MSTSLSELVDNLSEGLHNNKCVNCKSCLDYMRTKNEKLIVKCFNCKQNYEKDFNKELIKRFANTYEFCNKNLNKFILLLRKSVYPYEYMDNWERFDERSLPNKESFYSNLNLENIDDIDYRHGNNVFKRFKLKIYIKNYIKDLILITIYMVKAILYYLLMYLKTLEILVLKCMNLILLISYHYQV